MSILTTSPVSFINSATPLQAHFVIFCATTLGTLTILWVLFYLLIRPIPNKCIFAPFENMRDRLLHLGIVILSVVVAYVASVVLKNHFQIGRPILLNFDLRPLLSLSDYGFPSSHAAVFSAMATSIFLVNLREGVFVTLLALIITTARIFAGVHTPLDVVGGYLIGILAALLVDYIAMRIGGHPVPDGSVPVR